MNDIQSSFENLSQEKIQNAIDMQSKVMEAIIAADGGHTTYMSSGSAKKEVWFLWDFQTFCLKMKSYMLFCDKIIREVDQHFNNSIFGLLREVQSVIEDEIIWVFVTKLYLMERKWVTLFIFFF